MNDKTLKIVPVPEAKSAPETKSETPKRTRRRGSRKQLRMVLLIVLPAIALILMRSKRV